MHYHSQNASLNYICSGNDTDEIIFVGVLHAIRSVPEYVEEEDYYNVDSDESDIYAN